MAPFARCLFVVLLAVVESSCDNTTDKYNAMDADGFRSKFARLLTFNTEESGDITMELAFNVPFVTIPVKKSIDAAKGTLANVNVGAIVLAGAIALGVAVVIPGVLLLMSKKTWAAAYRSQDSHQWWEYLNLLDQTLTENNIDTTSCLQKMICWTVHNSAVNVVKGRCSSSDKIIDTLATSQWLRRILEGTAVHSAVENGLRAANCSQRYDQCIIGEASVQMWTSKIVEGLNRMRV